MKNTTIALFALCACTAQLTGCAGSAKAGLPTALTPFSSNGRPIDVAAQIRDRAKPAAATLGVYVSTAPGAESSDILEFSYQGTGSPLCTLNLSGAINAIQSDSENELIVPLDTGVSIYKE